MVVAWTIETSVWLYEGYQWTLTFADPRVEKWLFMSSPFYTFAWSMAYLTMVLLGPFLMSFLPALNIRPILVIFNAFMTFLNGYICIELFIVSWQANYSYRCQPVVFSYDPLEMKIAGILWWFYFSKFLEFADTLFFILRKKFSQLTFLHVYHHVTMFGFWWIGIKWVAGGSSFLGAMMNSFVHTIMYFYYGYTAAYPNASVWWKKYLTILQLVQFVIAIVQTAIGLYIDCPFPRWMGYTLIGYMATFILLFANFWAHAYARKTHREKEMTEAEIAKRKKVLIKKLKVEHEKWKNGFIEENEPRQRRSQRLKEAKENLDKISENCS